MGDFDVQLQRLDAKDAISKGNRNSYTDQLDLFKNGLNLSASERGMHQNQYAKGLQMLPLVNYTWLNETLSKAE